MGVTLVPLKSLNFESRRLLIIKAIYGDLVNRQTVEVDEKLRKHCTSTGLQIKVCNDHFTDPAIGVTKFLKIEYIKDGIKQTVEVKEGDMVNI